MAGNSKRSGRTETSIHRMFLTSTSMQWALVSGLDKPGIQISACVIGFASIEDQLWGHLSLAAKPIDLNIIFTQV